MLLQRIVPLAPTKTLNIYDIAEEDNASVDYHPPNRRFHYLIHFVVEGNGIFRNSTEGMKSEHKLSPNTLFAVYPKDIVFYQSDPQNPLRYYWIGFDGEESEKILNYIGFSPQNPVILLTSSEKVKEAFNALIASWVNKDKYILLSKFYDCVCAMREANLLPAPQLIETEKDILWRAREFIHDNLHNNIKVQDIINYLKIDRSYFTKIFKQKFDISPHEYIQNSRLSEAETLLSVTDFTIKEIVDLLNFPDTYTFSRQFKSRLKCSPTQYRKNLKRNVTSL